MTHFIGNHFSFKKCMYTFVQVGGKPASLAIQTLGLNLIEIQLYCYMYISCLSLLSIMMVYNFSLDYKTQDST